MNPRELQFIFYGYGAAWLILVVYVLTLVMREGRLRKELDRVRKMVEGPSKG